MTRATRSREELLAELEALRTRLEEAEETLRAIGSGEVDAFVVSGLDGDQVFTLKGAEQPYRDLVESMNEGAAMLDGDGTVLYSNHSLATLLQLPIETFVGTPFVTHVESSSHSKLNALIEKGHKERVRDEITLVTGGGLKVPVLISCCANELSPNWGVNVVISDITERKKDETLRLRMIDYTRSLIEASLDPLVTISSDGTITDVNEASISATGVPREQLIGTEFSSYFTDPEAARTGYRRVFTEGMVRDYPLAIHHRSGRVMDVLYNACVYKDGNGDVLGVFAAARDITELKNAEKILMQLNTELEDRVFLRTGNLTTAIETLKRSNQDLEQFAYVASHDLQEPLRMLSSFTQLLAQKYRGKLDQEADEYMHFVVDGANRMQSLIQDLLSYSRVSSRGKQVEGVDLNEILGAVHSSLLVQIQETGAVIGHDPLPTILSDALQMTQLFQNLLSNALKFRRSEFPLIRVSGCDEGDGWHFTVSDNGIGIEPQYFERIFKIFQRLHTRAEYPGTGIGLAVCKRIVERHGGRIWVESEPGKGTTVHFTLSKTATNEFMPDTGDIKRIME